MCLWLVQACCCVSVECRSTFTPITSSGHYIISNMMLLLLIRRRIKYREVCRLALGHGHVTFTKCKHKIYSTFFCLLKIFDIFPNFCVKFSVNYNWILYQFEGIFLTVGRHICLIRFPAFSALAPLVGQQEEHPAYKKLRGGCWHGYLSGARCRLACVPADATATHCLLLQ